MMRSHRRRDRALPSRPWRTRASPDDVGENVRSCGRSGTNGVLRRSTRRRSAAASISATLSGRCRGVRSEYEPWDGPAERRPIETARVAGPPPPAARSAPSSQGRDGRTIRRRLAGSARKRFRRAAHLQHDRRHQHLFGSTRACQSRPHRNRVHRARRRGCRNSAAGRTGRPERRLPPEPHEDFDDLASGGRRAHSRAESRRGVRRIPVVPRGDAGARRDPPIGSLLRLAIYY